VCGVLITAYCITYSDILVHPNNHMIHLANSNPGRVKSKNEKLAPVASLVSIHHL